jgi:2'-5' RNA ligase
VTLARLRPRERAKEAHFALEPLTFHGTAVTLYASRLHPSGARYEPLASAPLATP